MNENMMPTPEEVDHLFNRLDREAEAAGYHLNPDIPFTKELVKGLLINERRYGYWACPCRLASGKKEEDLDVICPCDYRDPDLIEYHACYCALYVSQEVLDGKRNLSSIPERRPSPEERKAVPEQPPTIYPESSSGSHMAVPGLWLPVRKGDPPGSVSDLQGKKRSVREIPFLTIRSHRSKLHSFSRAL